MFKRFLLSLSFVGLLAFGGCAGQTTQATISQIQQATVLVCSFLPTAATIAGILSAGNPALTAASDVAQAICTALQTQPKGVRRRGLAPASVNGVVIKGRYVR